MTKDLDRIRLVTRNFGALQGFRIMVPVGMLLVAQGIDNGHASSSPLPYISMAIMIGAICLMLLTPRYYRARFGEVETRPLSSSRRIVAVALLVLASVLLLVLVPILGFRHQGLLPSLITLLSSTWLWRGFRLFLGTALLVTGISRGPARRHHLVLGGVLLGLSIPPAVLPPEEYMRVTTLFCGVAMILAGVLDHWLLVRTLKPVEEAESEAYAEVGTER